MATDREIHTLLSQRPGALGFAADATSFGAQGTARPPAPPSALAMAAKGGTGGAAAAGSAPAQGSCQQCLVISVFFDGTGNNLEADVGTMQHSNVARLYQAHLKSDDALGRYRVYVPGIGTYFREIGDDGNNPLGLGLGYMGQERLDWALEQFDKYLKRAEARAQNPTNKINDIRLHVFGFSRGATAARAFVREMAERCEETKGVMRLKKGGYRIQVAFLGLFDTVASVGMPMSANNTPAARTAGMLSTEQTTRERAKYGPTGVLKLAFGEPGADPAPGDFDGHMSWADGLAVPAPALVKCCVHMVAAHEVRNSFPLDSVLNGRRYPPSTSEMVYPGAHSDVGGGYQPGEGARSPHYGDVLSLVPLRAMHAAALEAAVPLMDLNTLRRQPLTIVRSFALDPEAEKQFNDLAAHYNHYRKAVGTGGRDIGRELLEHGLWYFRWRFYRIARDQTAAAAGQATPEAHRIAAGERQFAQQRDRMQRDLLPLQEQAKQSAAKLDRVQAELRAAEYHQARTGRPVSPDLRARAAAARQEFDQAEARYLSEKAKLDTQANDSTLAAELAAYDAQLMADAQAILAHHAKHPKLKLRPHYANLVRAYTDEFKNGMGLSDPKVIAFFDRYVHDSLAGFAKDATLPSDPRVVYVGGDNKLLFAGVLDGGLAGDAPRVYAA